MSREFMNICQIERARLLQRISATEQVLEHYRSLYRLYGLLQETSDQKVLWTVARAFIADTVSPILKKQIQLYKESLELVTIAQEAGCIEVAHG